MKGNTNATPKVDKGIEILTLKLTLDGSESTSLDNATVIITDADKGEQTEYAYTQNGIVASIDAGHSYTITCKRKGTAMPPMKYNATSIKDYQRSLTLNYTTAPTGVYIYTMGEQLKTLTEFTGTINDIFGIYVGSSNTKLVLNKTIPSGGSGLNNYSFSGLEVEYASDITGINTYSSPNDAVASDFSGQNNTDILRSKHPSSTGKSYTYEAAYNTLFPDGRHGFLPAAGQANLIVSNYIAIGNIYNKFNVKGWSEGVLNGMYGYLSTSSFSKNDDSNYGQITCTDIGTGYEYWYDGGTSGCVISCYDLSV